MKKLISLILVSILIISFVFALDLDRMLDAFDNADITKGFIVVNFNTELTKSQAQGILSKNRCTTTL